MTNSELWTHLHIFLARRGPPRPGDWLQPDLPISSYMDNPRVVIHRDMLVRFRADYAALVAFVCVVVGKRPEELCGFDLVDLSAMQAHAEWEKERAVQERLGVEARRLLPELEKILAEANAPAPSRKEKP